MFNSSITLSLGDLLQFILFILGILVGVLLIVVLFKIFSLFKKLNSLVADNRKNIDELLVALPRTVESVHESVQSVHHVINSAGETMDVIGESVSFKSGDTMGTVENIIETVRVASEVTKAVINYFSKDRD